MPVRNDAQIEAGRAASTGLISILSALTMFFAAFSSAYLVRRGLTGDWSPLPVSSLEYVSLFLLVSISVLVEAARRLAALRFAGAALGIAFLLLQWMAWLRLSVAGITAAKSPAAAFFLVMDGFFSLCVASGLIALLVVAVRSRRISPPPENAVRYYWHYLSGLWIWLLILWSAWG